MFVSRRAVVAVVHPQHRDVRLHLHAQMQNHRFVRPEIRGDQSRARSPARPPSGQFRAAICRATRRWLWQFGRRSLDWNLIADSIDRDRDRLCFPQNRSHQSPKRSPGLRSFAKRASTGRNSFSMSGVLDHFLPDAIEARAGNVAAEPDLIAPRRFADESQFPPGKAARSRSGSRSSG